ncbi:MULTISPECIES: hypothetical protein [Prochlorococcus]|uniref:hypothetical protein n=1 Tax=Prochlorococcus TaxID=1218 RepID=UPI0007B33F63|nr:MULTISPECIES: hypothetical protein [Prochlorococcus]NMO84124.1 hypothetical protein [Prochlorococcus sp. P1344]NMP12441.1 hypothetical protein [Prochlorococcus sp.P1363]
MKLFSSIATAAVVAASTTFMAAPAEARSSTCWASDSSGSMPAMTCDVTRRTNNNGHVVWDVGIGSKKVTFVLWSNGVGEAIWADGTQRIFRYHIDSDGDPRLTGKGGWQFSFRV